MLPRLMKGFYSQSSVRLPNNSTIEVPGWGKKFYEKPFLIDSKNVKKAVDLDGLEKWLQRISEERNTDARIEVNHLLYQIKIWKKKFKENWVYE